MFFLYFVEYFSTKDKTQKHIFHAYYYTSPVVEDIKTKAWLNDQMFYWHTSNTFINVMPIEDILDWFSWLSLSLFATCIHSIAKHFARKYFPVRRSGFTVVLVLLEEYFKNTEQCYTITLFNMLWVSYVKSLT